MTWTPEQQQQRREWGLEELEQDPRNMATVDPMDAVLRRRQAQNGHVEAPTEPPPDVDLIDRYEGLIQNIEAYRAGIPTEIPWVCQPIAYSGGATLITGPPKAGKSTLTAQLQRCCETGDAFLGSWSVQMGPALLVTEEGGVAVAYKTGGLQRLDILDRRTALSASLSFRQTLDVVADWALKHERGIAFIDTLAIWAEIQNENDASEATRAVALVTSLAQTTGLAVVLVHHARKAGGENGEAIRGSGAILGTVDIAVEMSRVGPGNDNRWLDLQGRVIMPERHLLTFDRASMSYALDRGDARLAAVEADLIGVPPDGPGLTRNDLSALWKHDSRARTEQLVNLGRMRVEYVKTGRAWANRYWSVPAQWTPPMEIME